MKTLSVWQGFFVSADPSEVVSDESIQLLICVSVREFHISNWFYIHCWLRITENDIDYQHCHFGLACPIFCSNRSR